MAEIKSENTVIEFVSDEAICAELDISRTVLWRLRREGWIPAPLTLGRANRTPRPEIEMAKMRMIEKCKVNTGAR